MLRTAVTDDILGCWTEQKIRFTPSEWGKLHKFTITARVVHSLKPGELICDEVAIYNPSFLQLLDTHLLFLARTDSQRLRKATRDDAAVHTKSGLPSDVRCLRV